MVDIYPTLVETCKLPEPEKLDGQSLRPLLENPDAAWDHATITFLCKDTVSIRSERYRYTRYEDGSEEFYDEEKDPNEWNNLAGDAKYDAVKKEHAREMDRQLGKKKKL